MEKGTVQVLHLSPYNSLVDYCAGRAPTLCGLTLSTRAADLWAYIWVGDLITDPVDPAKEVACPKCFSHPDYPILLLGVI
jgi:hypothetical protein